MDAEQPLATETFTFEGLACWQEARRLRIMVAREFVKRLPADERWRLGDQLLRAARSTTANIAEGYGRYHYRDNYRFCSHSRGSSFEVLDHLITAVDEGLLSEASLEQGREAVCSTVKVLNGYMAYLRRHAREAER
jgi:four helix bundle protein